MLNNIAIQTGKKYLFFEPHNVKQIKESILIIQKFKINERTKINFLEYL